MDPTPMMPLRVAELLCSRLCHDLISPVAAVSNGIELLDDSGDTDGEIAALLSLSAGQAAGRLTFFRAAYGLGGAGADALTLDAAAALVRGIVDGDRTEVELPSGDAALGRGATKLLLNAAALGLEALPKAGRLTVMARSGAGVEIDVAAAGDGVALRPETVAAMDPAADPAALTARSVQGYFTAWLARALGGSLDLAGNADGRVRIVVRLPAAAAI